MGHSSIAITVDLYGHLIPRGNWQVVDRLDEPTARRWDGIGSATPAQPAKPGGVGDSDNPLNLWCARQELNLRSTGSESTTYKSFLIESAGLASTA
jgi:hypothetical protein